MSIEQLAVGATYLVCNVELVYGGREPGASAIRGGQLHRFTTRGQDPRVELVSEAYLAELCTSGMLEPVVGK